MREDRGGRAWEGGNKGTIPGPNTAEKRMRKMGGGYFAEGQRRKDLGGTCYLEKYLVLDQMIMMGGGYFAEGQRREGGLGREGLIT